MVAEPCSPFGAHTSLELSSPTPTSVIAATDHADDLHSLSRGPCGCRTDNQVLPPRARCHVDPHCYRTHGEEWERRAGEGSQLATEIRVRGDGRRITYRQAPQTGSATDDLHSEAGTSQEISSSIEWNF